MVRPPAPASSICIDRHHGQPRNARQRHTDIHRVICHSCHYDLRNIPSAVCPECGTGFVADDPTTYLTHVWVPHGVHRAIGAVLIASMVGWAAMAGGSLAIYFDVPSLIWVLGIMASGLWFSFGPGPVVGATAATLGPRRPLDRDRAGRYLRVWAVAYRFAWAAGLVGVTLSLIGMLAHLGDPSKIGAGLAIALLPVLYGSMLAEFVIAPMKQVLANRLPQVDALSDDRSGLDRSLMGYGFAIVFAAVLAFVIGWLSFASLRSCRLNPTSHRQFIHGLCTIYLGPSPDVAESGAVNVFQ